MGLGRASEPVEGRRPKQRVRAKESVSLKCVVGGCYLPSSTNDHSHPITFPSISVR